MRKTNLFIIGAAKSGTTTLFELLNRHKDIYMSPVKEPHFFSRIESKSPIDYLDPECNKEYHMKIVRKPEVYERLFSKSGDAQFLGEGSTSYMWDESSARRIYHYNSEAKIIAILRHPNQRAYSHFKANCMIGVARYPEDFYKEIYNDWTLKDKGWGKKGHLYVELGFYTQQLDRYYSLFKKENILIIKFDDLKNNLGETIKSVLKFLNLDDSIDFLPSEVQYNSSLVLKNKYLMYIKKMKDKSLLLQRVSEKMSSSFKSGLYSAPKENQFSFDQRSLDFLNEVYAGELKTIHEIYNINL